MLRDRAYQAVAVRDALTHWRAGRRRVLLIAPTGSGKTHMGCRAVQQAVSHGHPVLWLAHRSELVEQSQERLEAALGIPVGIVAAGYDDNPRALVQVASVQTLHARGYRPPARLLVIDECHHYRARTYQEVAEHYSRTPWLGLTATGERSDGKPLGAVFDGLVQAANYSELIEQGYLVPCQVLRPNGALERGLAQNPVKAYYKHTPGEQFFCFVGSVKLADQYAKEYTDAGFLTRAITDETPSDVRQRRVAAFRAGKLVGLTNCYTLTEGIDVPEARVAVLARGCGHVTPYLQMVGRVLRAAPDKQYATLIDLPGVSYDLGLPTADRTYSLQRGAEKVTEGPGGLSICLSCGWTWPGGKKCPKCGATKPAENRAPLRIYNRELQAVYDGARTPPDAKQREWERLAAVAKERGWSTYWAVKQYRELFGHKPPDTGLPQDQRRDDYLALLDTAKKRGINPGWAAHRYKATYGEWPRKEWKE